MCLAFQYSRVGIKRSSLILLQIVAGYVHGWYITYLDKNEHIFSNLIPSFHFGDKKAINVDKS